jgi:hypothetical protein
VTAATRRLPARRPHDLDPNTHTSRGYVREDMCVLIQGPIREHLRVNPRGSSQCDRGPVIRESTEERRVTGRPRSRSRCACERRVASCILDLARGPCGAGSFGRDGWSASPDRRSLHRVVLGAPSTSGVPSRPIRLRHTRPVMSNIRPMFRLLGHTTPRTSTSKAAHDPACRDAASIRSILGRQTWRRRWRRVCTNSTRREACAGRRDRSLMEIAAHTLWVSTVRASTARDIHRDIQDRYPRM